jgi:hypothetical protein
MKHTERLSKTTSSAIALLVIVVFLGLGSCPVKKGFHTLLGSAALSQDSGKGSIAAVCSGVEKSLSENLNLPQQAFTFIAPLLPADFLSGFPDLGIAPLAGKQQAMYAGSRPLLHLKTVPLYLRNSSLLI